MTPATANEPARRLDAPNQREGAHEPRPTPAEVPRAAASTAAPTRRRTALRWAAGAALVLAAWGVTLITPPIDDREAPFPISAEIGETVAARTFVVTLDEVRRTDELASQTWSAAGNWLVVDLTAEASTTEFAASLSLLTFEFEGRTYSATERAPDSFASGPLTVGIARSGAVAFELPAGATDGTGVLRISQRPDSRLETVVEVPIDLASLPVEARIELPPTRWTNP